MWESKIHQPATAAAAYLALSRKGPRTAKARLHDLWNARERVDFDALIEEVRERPGMECIEESLRDEWQALERR